MGIVAKKAAGIDVSDLVKPPREGASVTPERVTEAVGPEAKAPEASRRLFSKK